MFLLLENGALGFINKNMGNLLGRSQCWFSTWWSMQHNSVSLFLSYVISFSISVTFPGSIMFFPFHSIRSCSWIIFICYCFALSPVPAAYNTSFCIVIFVYALLSQFLTTENWNGKIYNCYRLILITFQNYIALLYLFLVGIQRTVQYGGEGACWMGNEVH